MVMQAEPANGAAPFPGLADLDGGDCTLTVFLSIDRQDDRPWDTELRPAYYGHFCIESWPRGWSVAASRLALGFGSGPLLLLPGRSIPYFSGLLQEPVDDRLLKSNDSLLGGHHELQSRDRLIACPRGRREQESHRLRQGSSYTQKPPLHTVPAGQQPPPGQHTWVVRQQPLPGQHWLPVEQQLRPSEQHTVNPGLQQNPAAQQVFPSTQQTPGTHCVVPAGHDEVTMGGHGPAVSPWAKWALLPFFLTLIVCPK